VTVDEATAARTRRIHMIAAILDLLDGPGHIAVGSSSPIPATAALLARRRDPKGVRVSLLGSETNNVFTDGNRELFDCAAQGRVGTFFFSGGQIDGAGRINLVGIGAYPRMKVRFPGSFGSAFLYPLVRRVILFREDHTPRTLVDKLDFISAAPGEGRPGDRNEGPRALVTGRCVFAFDPERRCFRLERLFPGESVDSVAANTGFAFDTAAGDLARLVPAALEAEIADVIATEIVRDYPGFARAFAA
jgi:glutaconate CoA-transferase subunit B